MKTEFYLTPPAGRYRGIKLLIVGKKPDDSPYVSVEVPGNGNVGTLQAADLERFAVNILKALNSKKLSYSARYKAKTFFSKKKK